ncbi:formyltetrahydrofolate deformylase [Cohnella thailandensis]|uniref:Formyltetrahydrofolate deformylase n=1 Tax=Cohnella thailandensis TaxID=557557 RepID=A0A841SNR4_9BACL|nr:formyltetrahydrofolate deformylase [Cohnella thailandensis]MBB6632822.1 formyltetrahydrofolate deformylase [Cohnella thailandensis]MBP1975486.1 formyltetrahydrofolate deformylase [Cohnella thailandensis]
MSNDKAVLLISCTDKPGIVAAVSTYLYEKGANIISSDQYSTNYQEGLFFMRVEFSIPNLDRHFPAIEEDFRPIANKYEMKWNLFLNSKKKRVAIFVSKEDHCLVELLWQWKAGDFECDIVMVVSNHEDLRATATGFGLPFYHFPVTKENKPEVEKRHIELLKEHNIDVIVLAKYMQIVSPGFIEPFRNKIINIHHSFLPAFVGAKPYDRAYERGVKIIGATAHFVTEELDAGPIIEQDIIRVSHDYSAAELKRVGRMVERSVIARALQWYLQNRVIIFDNKTVVFK